MTCVRFLLKVKTFKVKKQKSVVKIKCVNTKYYQLKTVANGDKKKKKNQ